MKVLKSCILHALRLDATKAKIIQMHSVWQTWADRLSQRRR